MTDLKPLFGVPTAHARTAKLLHSAQTIVIENATGLIKAASDGGEG